jgi:hypothetical protein
MEECTYVSVCEGRATQSSNGSTHSIPHSVFQLQQYGCLIALQIADFVLCVMRRWMRSNRELCIDSEGDSVRVM